MVHHLIIGCASLVGLGGGGGGGGGELREKILCSITPIQCANNLHYVTLFKNHVIYIYIYIYIYTTILVEDGLVMHSANHIIYNQVKIAINRETDAVHSHQTDYFRISAYFSPFFIFYFSIQIFTYSSFFLSTIPFSLNYTH